MRLETNRLAIYHLWDDDLVDLHRMDTDLGVRRYIDEKASSSEKRKNTFLKILLAIVRMDMVAMQSEITSRVNFSESAAF
jgi:hypothetical protein